jgi:rhodanese-related sulfurtransferase
MNAIEGIDPHTLEAWGREKSIELIDVRTDEEVRRGLIEGARHIPLHSLPSRYQDIARDKPVVLYCQSGARSQQAGAFLSARGWPQVYNLSGGVTAWLRSGRPIAQPS